MRNGERTLKEFDAESRRAALAEAHARPPVDVGNAKLIRHFAFQTAEKNSVALTERLNASTSNNNSRFAVGQVGELTVKLERHTEFYTCLVFDKSGSMAVDNISLAELLDDDDFLVLSDICISMHENQAKMLKSLSTGQRHLGGIMRGGMEMRTTLMPDENGLQTFFVLPGKMSSYELGRRLQRLLEMETYRVFTLLGLEAARTSSPVVTELENEVDALVARDWTEPDNDQELHRQLKELSDVSARLNALRAKIRFRFAASKAYYELAVQRLNSLEEEKTGDLQTLTGFVRSRLDPAISTIQSVERRLNALSLEIANALSLLRTRIDVELNQSNQQSLSSMNRRHRQQLLISQTVEGLSVVAISYYGVGLLSYLAKALKERNYLPFSETTATALVVPIVLGLVWLFIRRLRKHWQADETAAGK